MVAKLLGVQDDPMAVLAGLLDVLASRIVGADQGFALPWTEQQRDSTVSVATSSIEVVKGDPNRSVLLIQHVSGTDVWLRPIEPAGNTIGIVVAAGTTQLFLDRRKYGQMVGWPWYGITSAAAGLYVLESIRTNPGKVQL